jgi:hypothetical protein
MVIEAPPIICGETRLDRPPGQGPSQTRVEDATPGLDKVGRVAFIPPTDQLYTPVEGGLSPHLPRFHSH